MPSTTCLIQEIPLRAHCSVFCVSIHYAWMFDCIWDDKKFPSLCPPIVIILPASVFPKSPTPSCLAVFITLLFPLNIIFISDCHGTGEMRLLIKFGSRNAQRSAWLKCPQCVLNSEDEHPGGAVIDWFSLSQDKITASVNTDGVARSTPPQQATMGATCVSMCPGPLRNWVILREKCVCISLQNYIYLECRSVEETVHQLYPIMKLLSLFTHVLINHFQCSNFICVSTRSEFRLSNNLNVFFFLTFWRLWI